MKNSKYAINTANAIFSALLIIIIFNIKTLFIGYGYIPIKISRLIFILSFAMIYLEYSDSNRAARTIISASFLVGYGIFTSSGIFYKLSLTELNLYSCIFMLYLYSEICVSTYIIFSSK